jgi:hypothetical protein
MMESHNFQIPPASTTIASHFTFMRVLLPAFISATITFTLFVRNVE